MINIDIISASVEDIPFLLKNTKLSKDIINRKLKYSEIFIAKIGKKSVGLLILDFLWSRVPFIALIWVAEDYRNRKVGNAMLKFLENQLMIMGLSDLFSSSMENANDAQQWHLKNGFENCGLISGINPGDIGEIFFRKKLKLNSNRIT